MFLPKAHIDALVTAAFTWGLLKPGEFWFRPVGTRQVRTVTWKDATAIGEMLWRYSWDVTEGWVDPTIAMPAYEFERYPGEPDALVIMKAITWYEIENGGDPDEYEFSEVAGFLNYLRVVAERRLPGYAQLPFGPIDDREAFRR